MLDFKTPGERVVELFFYDTILEFLIYFLIFHFMY